MNFKRVNQSKNAVEKKSGQLLESLQKMPILQTQKSSSQYNKQNNAFNFDVIQKTDHEYLRKRPSHTFEDTKTEKSNFVETGLGTTKNFFEGKSFEKRSSI